MSKNEILAELPKLGPEDRADLLQLLWELQEEDLLRSPGPSAEEKHLLDEAWAEFMRDGDMGSPWRDGPARDQVVREAVTWPVCFARGAGLICAAQIAGMRVSGPD